MQNSEWRTQFDSEMQTLMEEYVKMQDFHAIETPLKTDKQFKSELKHRLQKEWNFKALSRGIFNANQLIHDYLHTLPDERQAEKAREELNFAFKTVSKNFAECLKKTSHDEGMNQIDTSIPIWTAIYGLSDETLLFIYELVLKCFKNKEIENSKDLLHILLMFAPTIPAYWNALGFCYQSEGNLDQALKNYLIAEDIDPDILDTHFYLARCYKAMNQKLLAQEQVEKISKVIAANNERQEQWKMQATQLAHELSNF